MKEIINLSNVLCTDTNLLSELDEASSFVYGKLLKYMEHDKALALAVVIDHMYITTFEHHALGMSVEEFAEKLKQVELSDEDYSKQFKLNAKYANYVKEN